MWEVRATYADGTNFEGYFEPNENISEDEDQYRLEEMVLNRHPNCTCYSVVYVEEE